MNRKLWLLNFVLIAAIAAGIWRVRKEAQEFEARKHATLSAKIPNPPAPPAPPATPSPAVAASSYLDIAQKMLWSRDRNSQVIVDPPKPVEVKPLPPLPSVHGVMNIGDGPIVLMSDKPGSRHRGIRPGEMIGDFKLVSVDSQDLVLSFEDRTVKKKLQDLIDHSGDTAPAGGAGQGQGGPPRAEVVSGTPPPPPPTNVEAKPGVVTGEGTSSCQPGDNSPAGTVSNGMRKVVMPTPFGPACRWEAIK